MSANDDYINSLKEEIAREKAFREAVVEEFKQTVENTKDFSAQDLKERFHGLLPIAFDRLTHLVHNAESEAVQLSAIKYIFNIATGQIAITDSNDPNKALSDLLEQIVTKDASH